MSDSRTRGWFSTFTGQHVDVFAPQLEALVIEDIAHALALTPRWKGHTKAFYSVAEHCIACVFAELAVPDGVPTLADRDLHLLLHDASEAYLGDMQRPIKHRPELAGYRRIESVLQRAIYTRFGVDYTLSDDGHTILEPSWLKNIDTRMLVTEARDLFPKPPTWLAEPWVQGYLAYPTPVVPKQNPEAVERQFLAMYELLRSGEQFPRRRLALRRRSR